MSVGRMAMVLTAVLAMAAASRAQTFFVDNFETDKGWSFGGAANQTWTRGTPAGGAMTGSDPVGAYAGTYCIGTNMAGSYASSESSYARSPAFSCTGYSQVYLHFYRWLGAKGASNTACSVQVSTDGASWTGVWGNPNPAIDDGAWANVTYDISAVAGNQSTVYVQFRLKDSGANPPRYTGWNIDNLLVDTSSIRTLAVALSSFGCALAGDAVSLSWRTECEQDCYRWQIERSSAPDVGYQVIGSVLGHGTTNDPQDYAYGDNSLSLAGRYYYRLAEIDLSGTRTYHGPVSVLFLPPANAAFQAGPVRPNPAHGPASISYHLPQPGRVVITVHDVAGRRIRTLFDGRQGAGTAHAGWDGLDAGGAAAANGAYLIRIEYRGGRDAGDRRAVVRKLVLAR